MKCWSLAINRVSTSLRLPFACLANKRRKVAITPALYKGMSRTFFPLRRRRGFGSRHPAPLTIEDARLVSCPWVIPSQQLHLLFSSDDADQFRNESSRAVVRCQPWIYLRLVA